VAANSRLTIAVHALAWLALAHRRGQERLTSNEVAASVNTNPVILRVSLGRLRRAGLVEVSHGAGAGWRLARPPEQISLLDVYDAVESEPHFGMHHTEPNQECPVGRGIRPALDEVYAGVDAAVRQALGRTSVAEVLHETLRRSEE
jgi:Rrf2 family protein